MRKNLLSSIIAQLILLVFVIIWIIPTFGLFVSSFRDKDLLAVSGWWTSLTTTQVNEIHRTLNKDAQIQENNIYMIKANIFDIDKGKKITSFGITSKNINQFLIEEKATLKDGSELTVSENGEYIWKSQIPFKNKKGKRIFITASSPPNFTLENYKEVLFKEGVGQAFLNTLTVAIPSTIIPLIICSFFAYALSWMRFFGRASRSEFWWFALFTFIGGIVTAIVDVMILGYSSESFGPINIIFSVITTLPALAVGARRLHDINKSGWWQLITLTVIGIILLIIWWATIGESKKNPHGNPIKLKK